MASPKVIKSLFMQSLPPFCKTFLIGKTLLLSWRRGDEQILILGCKYTFDMQWIHCANCEDTLAFFKLHFAVEMNCMQVFFQSICSSFKLIFSLFFKPQRVVQLMVHSSSVVWLLVPQSLIPFRTFYLLYSLVKLSTFSSASRDIAVSFSFDLH